MKRRSGHHIDRWPVTRHASDGVLPAAMVEIDYVRADVHHCGGRWQGQSPSPRRTSRRSRRSLRTVEVGYARIACAPPSIPVASASFARLSTPVLRKIDRRWFSTVCTLTPRAARNVLVGQAFSDVGGDFTLATGERGDLRRGTVIPEGAGCVKRLLSSGFAGFRPPCRQHWVRAGVKTERPQRSEDERS